MYCMLPMINIYNVDKKLGNIVFFVSVNILHVTKDKKNYKIVVFWKRRNSTKC